MPSLDPISSDPLEQVRRDIQTMKTRGAGEIGKSAVNALATVATNYKGDDVAALRNQLLAAAKLLASARPTAVTLRNALNALLDEAQEAKTAEQARKSLPKAAQAYGKRVDDAKQKIARNALAYFRDGEVVLTHCHSTAAGGAIAYAAQKRKGLSAFSTETRPFKQGLIQAPALAKAGVDVTLIVDSAVAYAMENYGVSRVVVGADTIGADGSLYNKVGTRQVAELARRFHIPFIVCAERDKFSPYTLSGEPVVVEERAVTEVADPASLPGVRIKNPVFDRTPGELIEAIITEDGPVKPADAGAYVRRIFGERKLWV